MQRKVEAWVENPRTTDNNNNDEEKKTVKNLVHDFMCNTTAHGIGRLADAGKLFWKIFWALVCAAAFGMFLFQVIGLFKMYFERPVTTKIRITFEKKLSFPAVTICNLNMLRGNGIPDSVKEVLNNLGGNIWQNGSKDELLVKRRRREDDYYSDDYNDYDDFDDYDYDEDLSEDLSDEFPDLDQLTDDFKLKVHVSKLISHQDKQTIQNNGHLFENFVNDCKWKGLDCKRGDFRIFWTQSWNYKYGNCYTFNSGVDANNSHIRILSASKPGPEHGLSLRLDVEQKQYIGVLTKEAGARVLLHGQEVMTFPYEDGFSISPGRLTSVSIKKTKIVRLDRFNNHSCLDAHELPEKNIYRKFYNVTAYTQQACFSSCLAISQERLCNCSEPSFPSEKPSCDILNRTTANCLQTVKYLFVKDQLKCLKECRQPCKEEIFEKYLSTSQWPSASYKSYLVSKNEYSTDSTESILKLDIYFDEFNFRVIEETFAYEDVQLVADIGGQLGLWIGISVLTVCELVELIITIFIHLSKILSHKQ